MAVADATKWFTRQAGDPATSYVSATDGVEAVTQTYTDIAAAVAAHKSALKVVVAASTDFADLKSRIAAW